MRSTRCDALGLSRVWRATARLIGQVIVLTLILMGVLLYKNRDRAGAFLSSFANFEGSLRQA